MKKSLFLSHPSLLDHGDLSHPENPARLKAILDAFEESPHKQYLDKSIVRPATIPEISQVHELDYINHVISMDGKESSLDPETPISSGSVKAAFLAAGLGIELVEKVMSGKIQNGFALVRPPGHHSRPHTAMGFCIFNNIAIAVKKALSMGLKRILILDWDVHHGNGTQETFYEDDKVMFIDLHQDNLFPVGSGLLNQIGKGKGLGFTVNIPLPEECRNEDYFYAFDKIVKPLARSYKPELILVSAGFDAHESDPLANMKLTTEGYRILMSKAKRLANELCGGKIILFLEGGYNPYFLAKNVMACVDVLVNDIPHKDDTWEMIHPKTNGVETLINAVNDTHVKRNT